MASKLADAHLILVHKLPGRRLLRLLDFFHNMALLLFLLIGAQVFAVFLYLAIDLVRVHEEDFVLFALGFLYLSVFVQLMCNDRLAIGVVLPCLVQFVLVLLDLFHQRGNIGNRGGGLLRETGNGHEARNEETDEEGLAQHISSADDLEYAGTIEPVPSIHRHIV